MKIYSDKSKNFLREYLSARPPHLAIPRAIEAQLYQKFLPLKPPILDVGCGDGLFAKITFQKQIDCGLEVSNHAAIEAQQTKIYKKVTAYDGKIFPFPDKSFNSVFSNSVLEHTADLNQVVSEIGRVLKNNGTFLFTVPTNKFPSYLLGSKLLGKTYEDWHNRKARHFHLESKKSWVERLKKYRFEILDFQYYLNNKPAMWFFDIAHYLGIPSLISKKAFGRWVLLPAHQRIFPWESVIRKLYLASEPGVGAYMIFRCRKPTTSPTNK